MEIHHAYRLANVSLGWPLAPNLSINSLKHKQIPVDFFFFDRNWQGYSEICTEKPKPIQIITLPDGKDFWQSYHKQDSVVMS